MILSVEYFSKAGFINTESCVALVSKMVREEGFRHVVAASTTGHTATRLSDELSGLDVNLVAVTHSAGFKNPNEQEFDPTNREKLEKTGVKVLTTTILTHSIETAFGAAHQGVYPTQIVAHSLRRLGEGCKVCCEIVMEAVDAGVIPEEEEVIAVAGTGRGADSVYVIRSAASKRFLQLAVLEVRAKPRG